MFISNYRSKIALGSESLMKCSAYMLSRLSDFCEMNSKTFCIARVSSRKDKNIHISLKKRRNFFKEIC